MRMSAVALIEGDTIAEVWERAVLYVWKFGVLVPKYGKETALIMKVNFPFKEPRIHPGDTTSLLMLKEYRKEVLEGTLDKTVEEGKVSYTYHERLFKYRGLDQIGALKEKLRREPYINRSQAITWMPEKDLKSEYPPCLQRIWMKAVGNSLIMHTTWRSRDLFWAASANMLVMTEIQKMVAQDLGLQVGVYIDFSDSAHIYEKNWPEVTRFVQVAEKRKTLGLAKHSSFRGL